MLAYLTSLLLFKYASCGLVSFLHMIFYLNIEEDFSKKTKPIKTFFGKMLTKQRKNK
jgi:hypothetical protein